MERGGGHLFVYNALRDLVPLHNLENAKKNHGGVLLSVNFQTYACNSTKNNPPPWKFFTFFKSYIQMVSNRESF